MLKKVRITNFLSCQDTEIEFDNITALIGRNAAGKTNILKAIEWCAQFAVGNVPLYQYLSQFKALKTECNIEFLIDNQFFKYEIKIAKNAYVPQIAPRLGVPQKDDTDLIENLWHHINSEWKLIARRNNESATHYNEEVVNVFEIKSQAPMISSMLALLPDNKLNFNFIKIFNYLNDIKYYTLEDDKYKNGAYDKLAHLVFNDSYEEWLSKNNKLESSESSIIMRLLHLWHLDKELFEELEALIGKNGLNLVNNIVIYKSSYGQQNEKIFYVLEFNIDNNTVNYTQLSYGTRRVLAILLALLYDKNSTLLIEQPEDGIHTGLLHKLLPLCFEYAEVYNKQLIITTHSSEAINLFQPENIRLVKMTENGTKVLSLDKEQMPFIHDYLKNEGALFDFIKSMNDE